MTHTTPARKFLLFCLQLSLWPGIHGPVTRELRADVLLPGTQQKEKDFQFRDIGNCSLCHSGTTNGVADPFFSWQGSMMAQAARDPVFRAALAIANQDVPGVGEFCIRCHAPRAWFEGLSSVSNASALTNEFLHGVSCEVCHRLVDPLSEAAKQLARQVPPGYGNGMMVIDPERVARGPYGQPKGLKMHPTMQSAYQASSELCANCHNVSNPLLAKDVYTQPPHAFGHIERTYSEWLLSDFSKEESLKSCQSCHFPAIAGGGQTVKYGDNHREYFVSHAGAGGSTWVQDAIYSIWKGDGLDRGALEAGKAHARALLKTAAVLGLEISDGKARLTITNLTGHKLPTGYPEGRRLWVNLRFLEKDKSILRELGRYAMKADTLAGQSVRVPTLLDPAQTRVYECLPAISTEQAAKYNKRPGPSFHFVLNDTIAKDNRIPPRGFKSELCESHQCEPVGGDYAEGQNWDQLEFPLPDYTARVEVRLMYQSVSWEYLKFLVEENRTDDWGRKLYSAWETTGKCPPEEIAFAAMDVPAGSR